MTRKLKLSDDDISVITIAIAGYLDLSIPQVLANRNRLSEQEFIEFSMLVKDMTDFHNRVVGYIGRERI